VKKVDWAATAEQLEQHGLTPLNVPSVRVSSEISEMKLCLTDEHIQTLLVTMSSLASSKKGPTSPAPAAESASVSKPPQKEKVAHSDSTAISTAVSVHLKHFSVDLGKAAPHPRNRLARKVVPLVSLNIDRLVATVGQAANGATSVLATIRSIAIRDTKPRSKNVFRQLIGPANEAQPAVAGLSASGSFTPPSNSGSEWETESTGTSEAGSSSSAWEPTTEFTKFLSVSVSLDPSRSKTSVRAQLANPRIVVVPSVIFDLIAFLKIATTIIPSDEFERLKFAPSEDALPPPSASPKKPTESAGSATLDVSADINSLEICVVRDSASAKTQAIVLKTSLGAQCVCFLSRPAQVYFLRNQYFFPIQLSVPFYSFAPGPSIVNCCSGIH
jgi:hypothetical protein